MSFLGMYNKARKVDSEESKKRIADMNEQKIGWRVCEDGIKI